EMESILLGQIASAESEIVEITGEQFSLAAPDPSDRLFRGANGYLETPYFAEVPESVTELVDRTATGGTAIEERRWWPVTEPDGNRAGKMLEGPFETGFWYRVSARWGWLAVPYQVKQAARMSAARLFERQAAVLGVVAGEVPIYVMHQDPDVRRLLSPFTPLV
ncbi:MAG: hypothetical protein OXH64_09330, partial [Rhodospirillaceae bacterium]|nr:hypothetical protein [Rhodospirillaceae bacterium]